MLLPNYLAGMSVCYFALRVIDRDVEAKKSIGLGRLPEAKHLVIRVPLSFGESLSARCAP